MRVSSFSRPVVLFSAIVMGAGGAAPVRAVDSKAVKAIFADPPRQYASAPLWVWNDMLTDEEVVGTLRDLAAQKVKQAFVHPRPGLMTPYLSPEWFRLWKVVLKEAERLDMNIWIYDENSYPSGFAGGFVPEAMPESRGRGLHMREEKKAPKWNNQTLAVFRLADNVSEDVTQKVKAGETLPDGRYLVADIHRAGTSGWYGGKFYVDLLYPGVTEKFLEITLDAYKREIGDQFGQRVPGSFTDEPQLVPAGGLPWTDRLPELFQQRWGYSLIENLPSLRMTQGDWKKVRHDYFQLLLEQFIERWAKPCYEYCEKNHLEFTGHYWDHDWPDCVGGPDNMAMYAWHQRPAIDCLMNQYREDTHAQFGNLRMPKELSSAANQLGRARTLCEAYGAGGWDLRFEDMKRIGDWLMVFGVNTLDEHLSYITIRGARKRDHPQSFSYHEPWWGAYHVMASYFTRLTAALTSGQEINPILVIEPTTTAWLYNSGGPKQPELGRIGERFFKLISDLSKAQVEYDIGCEDIIAHHGSVDGAKFVVGKRAYTTVVLSPMTETLNARTAELLEGFLKNNGTILCCGAPPTLVDGRPSDRMKQAAQIAGWKQADAATLPAMLHDQPADGFTIRRADGDKGILFHHRRQVDDGEIVFLTNTSIQATTAGAIESPLKNLEQWNLDSGKPQPYPFEATDAGIKASFELPPCGSLLLFLSKAKAEPVRPKTEKVTTLAAVGDLKIGRIQPNVLVLDYLDVTVAGEAKKDTYFYQACQFAFKKNGMERNPWDSAVQFKDELITKKFPPDSGLEATYRFTIEGAVPKSLSVVIERPDLYAITCNGQPVTAAKDQWWLDKCFGRIDLAAVAKTGENLITLKASPFTIWHELESAYVLGDFRLKAADKGFVIVADEPLKLGAWNQQGHPFYSAGASYTATFDVASPAGQYRVALPKWYGSVARVTVNGKEAGHISHAPWELDVTDGIKAGANTIEVVVIGTLKNTLGPHHGHHALGSAWPGMFQNGPNPGPPAGGKYDNVGYGLFEPLVLRNVTE
jgi:hypothetical protein